MNDDEKQALTTRVGVRGNVRAITITDNIEQHFDSLLQIAQANYEFVAWIIHDRDEGVSPHIHILMVCKGGTTLKTHCERFSSVVPANFVCKVKNPRAMAKYLIHKGYPNKYQYNISDVQTNQPERFAHYISDGYTDTKSVWHAFCQLKSGEITVDQFIDEYRAEFISMPFYQKVSLMNKLYDITDFRQYIFGRSTCGTFHEDSLNLPHQKS